MDKEEFEKLLDKKISDGEWDTIKYVYLYHPSIEKYGWDDLVKLYNKYGFALINDMVATAKKRCGIIDDIEYYKEQISKLEYKLKNLELGMYEP